MDGAQPGGFGLGNRDIGGTPGLESADPGPENVQKIRIGNENTLIYRKVPSDASEAGFRGTIRLSTRLGIMSDGAMARSFRMGGFCR